MAQPGPVVRPREKGPHGPVRPRMGGIEAVESDLGERIMQLMHRPPSHIVLPAIHVKRQEVGELFEREIGTEHGNSDPTYLTHAAREHLRDKFLHADAAMTGVNFAVASSGAFVVCTNEGNADMGTSFPKRLRRPRHIPPAARPLRHRTAFHHLHHPPQTARRRPGDAHRHRG